jgi:isopentenyl diphosphate isomerase/L-lactate dehydrogenase-like FMN-dependent dehydrogenase
LQGGHNDVDRAADQANLIRSRGVMLTLEPPVTWRGVARLRSAIEQPLIVKGVMSREDATSALTAGADAVLVSNHGIRTLGEGPGTVEVLEDVVSAVDGQVPVLLDGGVRDATDIAKALALGAAAVGLGRPVLWALAAGGPRCLGDFLEDLVDDLRRTLGLLGVSSVAGLRRSHVSGRDEFLADHAIGSPRR